MNIKIDLQERYKFMRCYCVLKTKYSIFRIVFWEFKGKIVIHQPDWSARYNMTRTQTFSGKYIYARIRPRCIKAYPLRKHMKKKRNIHKITFSENL